MPASIPLDEVTPTSPDSIGSILWLLISRTCECWSNFALKSRFCIVFLPLKSIDSKQCLLNIYCVTTGFASRQHFLQQAWPSAVEASLLKGAFLWFGRPYKASLWLNFPYEADLWLNLTELPVWGRPELTLTDDCMKPPGLTLPELHVWGQLKLTLTVRGLFRLNLTELPVPGWHKLNLIGIDSQWLLLTIAMHTRCCHVLWCISIYTIWVGK